MTGARTTIPHVRALDGLRGLAVLGSTTQGEALRTLGYDAWQAGTVRKEGGRKAVVVPSLGITFEGDTLQVR